MLPEEIVLLEGVADRLGLWFQQRRTQTKLLDSEQRFRNAILNAPNPIMIHAEGGEIIELNDAWLKGTGYSREELKDVPHWIGLAHPGQIDEIEKRVKGSYKKTFSGQEGVFPVVTKSGEKLNWSFSSAPLGSLSDGRLMVITIAIDITDKVKAEKESREYNNRLMALSDIDQMIVSTLDLNQVLALITSHLGKIINYDSMAIQSIDGDEIQIIACQGFNQPEGILNLRFPSEPGYPNYEVITERKTLSLTNVSEGYPKFSQPGKPFLPADIKAWLGVPLIAQHEVIGMLTIDRISEEPFTEQDIEIAGQYANRAAIAITNARLFAQTKDHLRRLQILRKIDATITSSRDLSDALQITLEQVNEGLHADVASVFLFDEDVQMLTYQQSYGYLTEGHPEMKVSLGQGYMGTVAATMAPLFIPEVEWVGRWSPLSL